MPSSIARRVRGSFSRASLMARLYGGKIGWTEKEKDAPPRGVLEDSRPDGPESLLLLLGVELRLGVLGHLQMVLEGGQGGPGPGLQVRVLAALGLFLELGHVLLVVGHHVADVGAVES